VDFDSRDARPEVGLGRRSNLKRWGIIPPCILRSFLACAAAFTFSGGMKMASAQTRPTFAHVLTSSGPSPQMPKSATSVFDWVVGDWAVDVYDYTPDGSKWAGKGEWHFSWVLEGRAIQDVWIVPRLADRNAATPKEHNRFGTSLRVYDPKVNAWRVYWFNPVTQDRTEVTARKIGRDIVQQGIDDDGSYIRWSFTDIKPNSFVWLGESSTDGGKTWQLGAKFLAHRLTNDAR
jgi:hypothetical protein